ncbi:MAG: electron transport complex subunit RsxC [Limnochordia bacterium]
MIAKTFPRGGAEIPHRKEATEEKPIVTLAPPAQVVIPLRQHIGAPCEPVVSVGDYVKMGQIVGDSQQFVSAPVHASVSGKVTAIEERVLLNGTKCLAVVIENDGKDEEYTMPTRPVEKMSAEAIRETVRNAGIVGMGGAGFPTHIKLNPPKAVDTVIINGAECEPYLTCDHRLMVERTEELVRGTKAIMKAAGAQHGIIAIEANKPDAIAAVEEAIQDEQGLSVSVLQVRYPQGAEKQLIKAVVNREVPSGKLPAEVGCIVSNVHTAISIDAALTYGKTSYERVVTVSGGAVVDPRNILVRIGTPLKDLMAFCGGTLGEPAALVGGGPMTGPPVESLDAPVVKNLSGILALTQEEAGFDENRPCIRCARCVNACPMGLLPLSLGDLSNHDRFAEAAQIGLMDCIECSLCSFVCPSKRALVTWIKKGKAGWTAQRRAASATGEKAV